MNLKNILFFCFVFLIFWNYAPDWTGEKTLTVVKPDDFGGALVGVPEMFISLYKIVNSRFPNTTYILFCLQDYSYLPKWLKSWG